MNSVLENYRRLSDYTGQMRSAAMRGEWDQLVALELRCSQHVETMKELDLAPIDERIRLQKVALINKILADDAAIRDQTLPWMAQLQNNMQSSRSEQLLKRAYHNEI